VVDLVGSQDPVGDWEKAASGASTFNFERTLA